MSEPNVCVRFRRKFTALEDNSLVLRNIPTFSDKNMETRVFLAIAAESDLTRKRSN
jgi:hypothetical protein